MLFYNISALIDFSASFILGLLVYLKNKKAILNRIFALFCLSVSAWGGFWFLWVISGDNKSLALIFGRALNIAAIFVSITYFHFITLFLNIYQKNKRLVIFGYLLSIILFISGFTSLFVRNVEPELSFPWYPKPGITYHLFTLMFFGYIIYCWYLMFRSLKKITETTSLQIKYVLLGTFIGFIGGSTSFLPVYNIHIPPFGVGLVIVAVIFITLAITRYHLFEIRVILTEILVAATGLTLLTQTLLTDSVLLKTFGTILVVLFSIFGYQLVRSVIREIELRAKSERLSSELVTLNVKLNAAYRELKKLDDAKSEFISIASHQLKTPLSATKGYISMILEKTYGKVPKKMSQPLENVYASNERLIKLVNDMLNISRIESGKVDMEWEKTSLEELISDVINELKIRADNKKLYLNFEKPVPSTGSGQAEPIPPILIDKTKIRQVILNFIDNSIKYTEKGGTTVKLFKTDSVVRVEVSDTGVGLEKDDIAKLFESFSRAKTGLRNQPEGTGLGMYIARKFIELHQGKIWAESPGKDKGSTFYIELPIK